MPKLRYIGPDGRFVPGVPARDLSAAEAAKFGGAEALARSGIYEVQKPPAKRRGAQEEE